MEKGGSARELTEQEDQLRRGLITPFGTLLSDIGTVTRRSDAQRVEANKPTKKATKKLAREDVEDKKAVETPLDPQTARILRRERRAYQRPPASASSDEEVIVISDGDGDGKEIHELTSDSEEEVAEDVDYEFLDDTVITEVEETDESQWAEDYVEDEDRTKEGEPVSERKRKRKVEIEEEQEEKVIEEDEEEVEGEGKR